MLAIYKKELSSYFTGVIGYVFLALYLAIGGAVFCYTTFLSMSASVTSYYLVMMLFSAITLPLLTMKSFSEERKSKTEQLLLTAPVSITSIVLGKFLAAFTVFGGAIVFNSLYFLFLYNYAQVKTAVLLGNLVAILLVGMCFIAIGLFVSALTENQLSAAIGTIAIILVFLLLGVIGGVFLSNYAIRYVFNALSIFTRFQAFVNGYFDISALVYYLSLSAIFLFLTVRIYDHRRYN